MSDSINWLQEIADVPKNAVDPLADAVMQRFNGAVAWQSTERVNGKSLRTVLQQCWEQQNGILSCTDAERARELGVDAVMNITALKASVANSFLSEALTSGTSALPWVIQPTPRPDISPLAKEEILQSVKETLFAGGFQAGPEIVEVIRQAKRTMMEREKEKAAKSAQEMTTLIEDQCAEGNFHKAVIDFLQYFPIYPFAVFAGPYITRAPRLTWGQKKPRMATEVFPTFRAINPFDFCYSPDSPDTQRGSCVFTRTLWTRKELIDAASMNSYLQQNVMDVLKECEGNVDFNLTWLSRAPDSPKRNLALWQSNVAPLEVLTHYGLMSGRELNKYGFTGLDATEFYNCEIAMAGYRVIQVKVMTDPKMQTRPIYTASFYRTGGDRIAGDGIAQRIRDIERAYHACLAYLMRNAMNASAPLCEADYKRLAKYMTDSDLGNVVPGMMYLADADASNSGKPALQFTNIPSNMPAYLQIMEMFMQAADRFTNIPAALHGEAVGSGALRTFRGLSLLQGNATKAFTAAIGNMSDGIFAPLGVNLYNINMLYSSDPDVKGDAQIVPKGAEGILQKEMQRQDAQELLMTFGQLAQGLGQYLNLAPVIAWGVKELVGTYSVPEDVLAQVVPIGPGAGVGVPNGAPMSPDGAGIAADVGGMPVGGVANDSVM